MIIVQPGRHLADSNGAVPRTRWRLQVLFWDLPDFLPCFSQNCGGSTGPSIRVDAGLGEKGSLFNNHQKKSLAADLAWPRNRLCNQQSARRTIFGKPQSPSWKHSICIRPAPNTGKWEQHVSIWKEETAKHFKIKNGKKQRSQMCEKTARHLTKCVAN